MAANRISIRGYYFKSVFNVFIEFGRKIFFFRFIRFLYGRFILLRGYTRLFFK